ncbi:chemotaxis protein CheW [Pseudochelatococcus contaminans]|uniref:Purine-binding chemotaxis protein CheW n=1 Tax=Pseudochelatococcus contaminans TaxID=1538103 RepID=A0A7W5Z173_9HYPH|nr:chemotaxis protein CheW [Pseudochelatococcus contaminans]MBB3807999.1 purine-binding chemotaxis protein CheW [Pseudochelatococcus contaminans]
MSMQLAAARNDGQVQFVTIRIAGQLFGLPIWAVHDVFVPQRVTPVPLSPSEIDGVLNLRGRIVTAINMRLRLGFQPRGEDEQSIAVGVDYHGESFGLLVDEVGEVLTLDTTRLAARPPNLDPRWNTMTDGVFSLDAELMAVLDVEAVLANIREDQTSS